VVLLLLCEGRLPADMHTTQAAVLLLLSLLCIGPGPSPVHFQGQHVKSCPAQQA
jgi:hypothetical protein